MSNIYYINCTCVFSYLFEPLNELTLILYKLEFLIIYYIY